MEREMEGADNKNRPKQRVWHRLGRYVLFLNTN